LLIHLKEAVSKERGSRR